MTGSGEAVPVGEQRVPPGWQGTVQLCNAASEWTPPRIVAKDDQHFSGSFAVSTPFPTPSRSAGEIALVKFGEYGVVSRGFLRRAALLAPRPTGQRQGTPASRKRGSCRTTSEPCSQSSLSQTLHAPSR